eukprot:6177993-Pleurochrysis_carterae.AAC.1
MCERRHSRRDLYMACQYVRVHNYCLCCCAMFLCVPGVRDSDSCPLIAGSMNTGKSSDGKQGSKQRGSEKIEVRGS